MTELWPFIQSLVKKWRLEGRTFTFGRFLLELAMDGYFQLLHHSNRNFMVSNNILKVCRPNSFTLWLLIQRYAWHLWVKALTCIENFL